MLGLILRRSVAALALCTLLFGSALAFQPTGQNDMLEIPLPEFDLPGYSGYDRDMNSQQVSHDLSARLGSRWEVFSWNPQTGTPHWVHGNSVKMASSIDSAEQLTQLAEQVIFENRAELKADLANLRLTATPNAMGKWVAHYQQTYDGIDVWDARVRIAFSDDGKLMLMGSDYYTGIDLNTTPSIDEASAIQLAKAAVGFNPATDRMDGAGELLILPYPISASEVEHHLVWRLRVRTEDPLGIWVTHLDAHTGEIIWRYNDIHFAYGGDTDTDVQIYGYCDGVTNMTVPYLRIDVSGLGSVVADGNGDWSIAGTGGNRTVSCDMEGPYVDVFDNLQYPEAAFTGTAGEDVPFTVDWDAGNSKADERDVFDAVNDLHDYFQLFAPEFAYANQQIGARVSLNSTCNAYWDGNINFYREGGGCGNTGEMQQVVHHEVGHGIQNAILNGQGSQGLGEGNGDIIGNLITQDSTIGRGFYLNQCGDNDGIRNSDNNLVYPDHVIGQEIHFAGQVIAGFNWDAMLLLQDLYGGGMNWNGLGTVMSGERWHYGRVLLHPNTQPDQVYATFFADDDNGDLGDGTPHHAIFCEAAQNHGFDCPEILVGVFLYHDGIPYSGDQSGGYEVVGQAVSLGGGVIVPGSVTLNFRVDGGAFTTVAMAGGGGDDYVGTIPGQVWGSEVEYYLYAENDEGASGTSPASAPADLHYFQVDQTFTDEMEFDTAWRTGGLGEDTASTGRWERADPVGTDYNGTTVQPEDDHTAAGTECWVTGAASGGSAGGNDVDGGRTVLYSPRFDLDNATDVMVSYWRYYTNDAGNNPGQDVWLVEISNDDGGTWTDVENTTASSNAWVEVSFALADYFAVPGTVVMRFTAEDLPDGSLVEALVDDFTLSAIFDLTNTDDGFAVSFMTELGQNHPNPFNPKTAIKFSLEQAGPVSLRVFDVNGRVVKTLADGNMTAGGHEVIWNGQDENGSALASGVYFYRLQAEGRTMSKRMVLIK